MSTNPFATFIPQEEACQKMAKLGAGCHLVTIEMVEFTTDNARFKDEPDDPLAKRRCWVDENPVLYVYMVSPNGVCHYRYYWNGYKKWDQVKHQPELYRPPKSALVRQHAIHIKDNTRVISDENSAIARKILNQFCTAAGVVGGNLMDLKGKQLWIDLAIKKQFGDEFQQIIEVSPPDKPFDRKPVNARGYEVVAPRIVFPDETEGAF